MMQEAIRLIKSLDRQLEEAKAEIKELKDPPLDKDELLNVSMRLKKQYLNMFATRNYVETWVNINTIDCRYIDAMVKVRRKHIESVRKYATHMEIAG